MQRCLSASHSLSILSLALLYALIVTSAACSAEDPAQCVSSSDCPDGERCVDGACSALGDAGADSGGPGDGGSDAGPGDSGVPCVPVDCDDGNECTIDRCTAAGCENTNSDGACDDDVFCNGADSCADGSCSVHGGDPCGTLVCNEGTGACDGDCVTDIDCPDPVVGAWGVCGGFANVCSEDGSRSRETATFRCESSRCVGSTSTEMESCVRDTDGTVCDDGDICSRFDRCTGGVCEAELGCPPPCMCNPTTGACTNSGGGRCLEL